MFSNHLTVITSLAVLKQEGAIPSNKRNFLLKTNLILWGTSNLMHIYRIHIQKIFSENITELYVFLWCKEINYIWFWLLWLQSLCLWRNSKSELLYVLPTWGKGSEPTALQSSTLEPVRPSSVCDCWNFIIQESTWSCLLKNTWGYFISSLSK